MMRRALTAILLSVLLVVGLSFSAPAHASASRTCFYVKYLISDNALRICMPFFADA